MSAQTNRAEARPRSRPGGRTREHSARIFANAAQMLAQNGHAAFNFRDLAALSGVNRSTLYRRWSTTTDLVFDVLRQVLDERIQPADTGSLAGDLAADLRQVGAFVSSPLGQAAIALSVELERKHESTAMRRLLWDERLANFAPTFARAKMRGELPIHFDADAALAMTSGAMVYRVLLMARPIDELWIARIVSMIVSTKV